MKSLKVLLFAMVATPMISLAGVCDGGIFRFTAGGRTYDEFTGTIGFQSRGDGRVKGIISYDIYGGKNEAMKQVQCIETGYDQGILTFTRYWSTGNQFYKIYIYGNRLDGSFNYYGDGLDGYTHHYLVGQSL